MTLKLGGIGRRPGKKASGKQKVVSHTSATADSLAAASAQRDATLLLGLSVEQAEQQAKALHEQAVREQRRAQEQAAAADVAMEATAAEGAALPLVAELVDKLATAES